MKLTLLTAVRNEGARMEGFMEHHAPYFDEVVVVHDGPCTDGTVEIAARYDNARVFLRPGEHNPHPHREWALRNVIEGGWVVLLDADERLDEELLLRLRDLVEGGEERGLDGFAVTMRMMIDDHLVGEFPTWRIFKHSDRVSQPEHPHGGIEGILRGELLEYKLVNRMRAVDVPKKNRRWNAILRRLIREQPNSPRRVAWEKGLQVGETYYRPHLERAGVSLEADGRLRKLRGASDKLFELLADIGIETPEELASGDTEYIARATGYSEGYIEKVQRKAGEL